MTRGLLGFKSWFQCLVVTFVTLGFGIEAAPCPVLMTVDAIECEDCDDSVPCSDDVADEISSDVSDRSWHKVKFTVRRNQAHSWFRRPFDHRSGRFETIASANLASLPTHPTPGSLSGSVGIPISLCRLTC